MHCRTHVAVLLVLFGTTTARAQTAAPLPAGTRSVEVISDGAVITTAPSAAGIRRGTVKAGTRLAVIRRLPGDGCQSGFWIQVTTDGYVCDAHVAPSPLPPVGMDLSATLPESLLPNVYGVVRYDGTRRYAHPSDYEADDYYDAVAKGFAIVMGETQRYGGVDFVRTRNGLWIEKAMMEPPKPSAFQGTAIAAGAPRVGWVLVDKASVYADGKGAKVVRKAARREMLALGADRTKDRVALADGTWMRHRDVAEVRVRPRPATVGDNEKWIDVDVDEQVLTAFIGDSPVFATLVSTGKLNQEMATPLGEFRLWVKLAASDMDDVERTDVDVNYSVESVPWVQYFQGAAGFHSAFWHDDFGKARRHGCVNLSPADAKWLFNFTGPALPLGWYAVLPTATDLGTVVRVRSDAPSKSH